MPALRMPRKGPAARIAEQAIEALIPGLARQGIDVLTGMGEADQEGAPRPAGKISESAVIVATPTTEAASMMIKSDQRQTDGVEGPQSARQTARRLPKAEVMPDQAPAMPPEEQAGRCQTR